MGRPQQPELARSGRTDLDPDRIGTELEGRKELGTKGRTGPVPAENEPGHHPPEESDKPDLDAFAAKLGAGGGEDEHAAEAPPAPNEVPTQAATTEHRQPAIVGFALGGLRFTGRALGALQQRVTTTVPELTRRFRGTS